MRLGRYLSLADIERAARRRLPRLVHGFVAGGAEDEQSLRANRSAFAAYMLRPRGLAGVAQVELETTLWGRRYSAPFGVAPMGVAAICRHEADRAIARAAHAAQIPYILSGASTYPLEQLATQAPGFWYQAYLPGDTGRLERIVQRLERARVEVLVVTCDTAVAGNRENNLRNGFMIPFRPSLKLALDGLAHPRWLLGVLGRTLLDGGVPRFANLYEEIGPPITREPAQGFRGGRELLGWEHMAWLRQRWAGRIVLKGVLHPTDAELAVRHGLDGVIVSNHGGRQLDSALPALLALQSVRQAVPADYPVMLDGGVRRGTDVLKALALGARMVFVGRPFLYGAAIAGEAGARHVAELLRAEVRRDLALMGVGDAAALDPGAVEPVGLGRG